VCSLLRRPQHRCHVLQQHPDRVRTRSPVLRALLIVHQARQTLLHAVSAGMLCRHATCTLRTLVSLRTRRV
jgi:hypothetical protein